MDLSTVGRLAGLPRGGPVLDPLRQDRGHGHRARGGAGRRSGRPHRGPGPPGGHRAEPHPAVRGQRGDPRGDHRGPAAGPPGPRRRRGVGLRLRHLRRRPRRLPPDPAPGGHARRYSASTTQTESERNFETATPTSCMVLDEADPVILGATLARGRRRSAPEAGARPWTPGWSTGGSGHRNDVSALAPLWRGGIVVDTAEISGRWPRSRHCPTTWSARCSDRRAPWPPRSHQSHAYPDGACLYFTFAGRPPTARRWPTANAAGRAYYRQAWDTVTGATRPARRGHQPPPRHRPQPCPLPGRALGGLHVLVGLKAALDPTASSTRASSACPRRSAALEMSGGGEHPGGRRRHLGGAGGRGAA